MDKLFIFNGILLIVIITGLFLCKKLVKKEKSQNIVLLLAAILTILCHYSSILYHYLKTGSAMEFLRNNPNLLFPIYPCNVVMWGCLIFGLSKNKKSKVALFLADYLFWFGIVSTTVGMFANIDFFNNPTLRDYDVTKGIVAHATLLFNVLLICVFGYVKIDLLRNIKHIIVAVIMMFLIGAYCNLLFEVLVSTEKAYYINSMFMIHSPFEAIPFLTYPIISSCAIVIYFGLFALLELFKYEKGNRWFNRLKKLKQ